MGKESGAKVVELQCVEEKVEFWSSRGFVRTRKGKQCTYAAGEGYVHMSASVQSVMTAIDAIGPFESLDGVRPSPDPAQTLRQH